MQELQLQVAQLKEELARERLQATIQQNANSLPAMVKPALPAQFIGKIDSMSMSRFVHQLDNYFKIVCLNDDIKMG